MSRSTYSSTLAGQGETFMLSAMPIWVRAEHVANRRAPLKRGALCAVAALRDGVSRVRTPSAANPFETYFVPGLNGRVR